MDSFAYVKGVRLEFTEFAAIAYLEIVDDQSREKYVSLIGVNFVENYAVSMLSLWGGYEEKLYRVLSNCTGKRLS